MVDGISERPWTGINRSSYPSAGAYCAACVIDQNPPGTRKTKDRCKLPVIEPPDRGGELNRRGVHAATDRLLSRVHGVDAPAPVKRAAARRLVQLYRVLQERPPAGLTAMAAELDGAWLER